MKRKKNVIYLILSILAILFALIQLKVANDLSKTKINSPLLPSDYIDNIVQPYRIRAYIAFFAFLLFLVFYFVSRKKVNNESLLDSDNLN